MYNEKVVQFVRNEFVNDVASINYVKTTFFFFVKIFNIHAKWIWYALNMNKYVLSLKNELTNDGFVWKWFYK